MEPICLAFALLAREKNLLIAKLVRNTTQKYFIYPVRTAIDYVTHD